MNEFLHSLGLFAFSVLLIFIAFLLVLAAYTIIEHVAGRIQR